MGVAHRRGDHGAIEDARRALAAANLEAYIEHTLAKAPPLSDEQRMRIAALLLRGAA